MTQSIVNKIEQLLENGKSGVIIAIDGRCGAGKTTLADFLAKELDCGVIRMDDFFLRPEQRTPERFSQPGGNVDRERFVSEVLVPLSKGKDFCYQPFDCSQMALGKPVEFACGKIAIVEGSYCCHPELWDYYDLHIFCDVSPETQMQRIAAREGEQKAAVFAERWIPLEEKYFAAFDIKKRCETVVEYGF